MQRGMRAVIAARRANPLRQATKRGVCAILLPGLKIGHKGVEDRRSLCSCVSRAQGSLPEEVREC